MGRLTQIYGNDVVAVASMGLAPKTFDEWLDRQTEPVK